MLSFVFRWSGFFNFFWETMPVAIYRSDQESQSTNLLIDASDSQTRRQRIHSVADLNLVQSTNVDDNDRNHYSRRRARISTMAIEFAPFDRREPNSVTSASFVTDNASVQYVDSHINQEPSETASTEDSQRDQSRLAGN